MNPAVAAISAKAENEVTFEKLRSFILGDSDREDLLKSARATGRDTGSVVIAIPTHTMATRCAFAIRESFQGRAFVAARLTGHLETKEERLKRFERGQQGSAKHPCQWVSVGMHTFFPSDIDGLDFVKVRKKWIDWILELFTAAYVNFMDEPDLLLTSLEITTRAERLSGSDIPWKTQAQEITQRLDKSIGERGQRLEIARRTDEWDAKGLSWKERCAALDEMDFGPDYKVSRLKKQYESLDLDPPSR